MKGREILLRVKRAALKDPNCTELSGNYDAFKNFALHAVAPTQTHKKTQRTNLACVSKKAFNSCSCLMRKDTHKHSSWLLRGQYFEFIINSCLIIIVPLPLSISDTTGGRASVYAQFRGHCGGLHRSNKCNFKLHSSPVPPVFE